MGADINARVYEDTKRFCEQSSSHRRSSGKPIFSMCLIRTDTQKRLRFWYPI